MEPAPFRQLPGATLPPARAFFLRAADDVRLRVALWPATAELPATEQPGTDPDSGQGSILLFTGRTEYCEKYAPVAQHLTRAGHAVLAIDWRGQGASDRLAEDPTLGHVGSFTDYQLDVAAMLDAAGALALPRPWHLLSHSMGGAIALRAMEAGLPVASAAFSAPMWDIHLGPLPTMLGHGIAASLAAAAELSGHGAHPVPGVSGVLDIPFSANRLTSDINEYTRLMREAVAWPDLVIGPASYAWLRAAMTECHALAAMPAPDLPALISASGQDGVVGLQSIRKRAARWPRATLMDLPTARHEVMFEAPALRERFIAAAVDLFAQH